MKSRLLCDSEGQTTHVLILETGDELVSNLLAFARNNRLSASHLTGIGAFEEVTLGYFEWSKKDYKEIRVREQVEVLSLMGDIVDGENSDPTLHVHVVLGNSEGLALGGHLLRGIVRPTLEVILVETPVHLRRSHDLKSGLALIRL